MTKYEKLCITCHLSRCDGPNAKRCPQQKMKKLKPSRGAHTINNGIRKNKATGGYWPEIHGSWMKMNYDEECRAILAQLQDRGQ